MKKGFLLLLMTVLVIALVPVSAHDAPTVEVSDQVSLDGTVVVDHVTSDGPGFIVIHIDDGGAPGPVAGFAAVEGENDHVHVAVDTSMVTPVLYAMLHLDDHEIGTYEFGSVEGADAPVIIDGAPITPAFNVALLDADPQVAVTGGTFTANAVVIDVPGWLVIHNGAEGRPGPVLGKAPLVAGNNANVTVTLDEGDITPVVFPMIHVDTNEPGVYEFGSVEGADSPVSINGVVATVGVSTTPVIVASDQIVLHGENHPEGAAGTTTFTATVLSEGPGFLVIHQDANNGPGPVAGVAPVVAGLNENVVVELDPAMVTPVLWPMLHADTGEAGVYEFGTVPDADLPVSVGDQVVMLPVNVFPSFRAETQALEDGMVEIDAALIDAPGWMVIHSSVNGGPGPVVGYVHLRPGLNTHILVPVDLSSVEGAATDQVFPMLHYDTGELGVYEFGTVEGADLPVMFGGSAVVGPLTLE